MEQKLHHLAAGRNGEDVVSGENVGRQEGMSAGMALRHMDRGYGEMLPVLCRATLLLARDIRNGVPSTVKYCSCATARYFCKRF